MLSGSGGKIKSLSEAMVSALPCFVCRERDGRCDQGEMPDVTWD